MWWTINIVYVRVKLLLIGSGRSHPDLEPALFPFLAFRAVEPATTGRPSSLGSHEAVYLRLFEPSAVESSALRAALSGTVELLP